MSGRIPDTDPVTAAVPALIAEAVARFGRVRVRVAGTSMRPAIRSGDVVSLTPATDLRPGQVAAFVRDGRLFTHRVLASVGDTVRTRGDAHLAGDPPLRRDQVIGVVSAIERDGVVHACPEPQRFRGLLLSVVLECRIRLAHLRRRSRLTPRAA